MAFANKVEFLITAKNEASKQLKTVDKDLKSVGKTFDEQTKGAQGLTKAVGIAGSVLGGLAVKEFADFEKTMSGVNAVLQPTGKELENLTELAKEQGRITAFSATESALGIEMLAKNGLDASKIIGGALAESMKLASAGGVELSTAADVATDVMNLWKLEANELGDAVNGITGVMQTSKFTVDDFRLALAQGGGIASTVGVSFDDFTTSIAGISPFFASGSDAGTSFKTMLQRLIPAGKPATEMMMELGLITADGSNQFFDAAGNMKSMADVSQVLKDATKNLTEEQKNNALSTLFGADAMRAAAGVAELGKDAFDKLQGQIQKVDAGAVAAERLNNLKGKLTLLKSAISGVAIEVGSRLAPIIEKSVVYLTDLIVNFKEKWDNLSPSMQKIIKISGLLAAGIAGLVTVVGALGLILGPLITGFTTIITILGFVLSPIGLVIAAVTGLGIAWSNNFLGIQDITKTVLDWLKNAFTSFTGWIEKWSEKLSGIFSGVIDKISNVVGFAKDKLSGIGDSIKGVGSKISGLTSGLVEKISGREEGGPVTGETPYIVGEKGPELFVPNINGRIISNKILSGLASGLADSISGKAKGGPVNGLTPYIVGERGPELFVPNNSGTIVPNQTLNGGNVNINLGGVTVNNEADENRLVEKIKEAMTTDLQFSKFGAF